MNYLLSFIALSFLLTKLWLSTFLFSIPNLKFKEQDSPVSILAVVGTEINQPLIPIKRGLNFMLFTSFWCPEPTSTSRNTDTGLGNRN